jgi:hypothetical protein
MRAAALPMDLILPTLLKRQVWRSACTLIIEGEGLPVSVTISKLFFKGGSPFTQQTISDGRAKFALNSLPPGEYRVCVQLLNLVFINACDWVGEQLTEFTR